jgi:hypothetical protein
MSLRRLTLGRRWKNLIIGILVILGGFSARNALADTSPNTKRARTEMVELAKSIKHNKGLVSEEDVKKIPGKLINYINFLGKDVIKDLKDGKYKEAIKGHKKMLECLKLLGEYGSEYDIKKVEDTFNKIAEHIKTKKTSKSKADLPIGSWIFIGDHFVIQINITPKGNKKKIDIIKGGFPFTKEAWKKACEGIPESVIREVERQLNMKVSSLE